MNHRSTRAIVPVGLLAVTLGLLTSCGSDGTARGVPLPGAAPPGPSASAPPGTSRSPDAGVIDPGDGGNYRPNIDPTQFVDRIDNRYLPLAPGSRRVYEGQLDSDTERIELEVTTERKVILGITATGVRDTGYTNGEHAATTMDWYAQDRAGNVWYLGENTQNYENGKPAGTEGWEAGVEGAQPGNFMLADPKVGTAYREAYRRGQVEDTAEVLRVGVTHAIGLGAYQDVIVVRGWSRLDPEVIEEKYYAPGVGKIYETLTGGRQGGTELVTFTPAR
jgi:hypothetical protein